MENAVFCHINAILFEHMIFSLPVLFFIKSFLYTRLCQALIQPTDFKHHILV